MHIKLSYGSQKTQRQIDNAPEINGEAGND